jgi:hypothetical protein
MQLFSRTNQIKYISQAVMMNAIHRIKFELHPLSFPVGPSAQHQQNERFTKDDRTSIPHEVYRLPPQDTVTKSSYNECLQIKEHNLNKYLMSFSSQNKVQTQDSLLVFIIFYTLTFSYKNLLLGIYSL